MSMIVGRSSCHLQAENLAEEIFAEVEPVMQDLADFGHTFKLFNDF